MITPDIQFELQFFEIQLNSHCKNMTRINSETALRGLESLADELLGKLESSISIKFAHHSPHWHSNLVLELKMEILVND